VRVSVDLDPKWDARHCIGSARSVSGGGERTSGKILQQSYVQLREITVRF